MGNEDTHRSVLHRAHFLVLRSEVTGVQELTVPSEQFYFYLLKPLYILWAYNHHDGFEAASFTPSLAGPALCTAAARVVTREMPLSEGGTLKNRNQGNSKVLGLVVHVCNPCTQETVAGKEKF